ncbi:MAG: hypothetical protein PHO10_07590 [Gemmiger sp.]|nr:hypothetical protein [Gemmiger sp.]
MQSVKKVIGVLLIVVGVLGGGLAVLLLAFQLWEWVTGGFYPLEVRVTAFLAGVLTAMVLLVVGGVALLRSPPPPARAPRAAPQPPPTFLEQERAREWEQAAHSAEVPTSGPYIWKYQGKTSAGKHFAGGINGFLLGVVVLGLLFCLGLVQFGAALQAGGMDTQATLWLETLMIFAISGVLVYLALMVGRRGNSQQIAFARDKAGRLYRFDYRAPAFRRYAKGRHLTVIGVSTAASVLGVAAGFYNNLLTGRMIEQIDREGVVESIMASGQVYPYGNEIVSVEKMQEGPAACRVFCTLQRADGTRFATSIVLAKTYRHFDALRDNLQRLM